MNLHPLLVRQLQRTGLDAEAAPPACRALLERVSEVYADADQERYRLERMISMCSDEMSELNAALAAERDRLVTIVASMAEGLCVLEGERLAFANAAALSMLGLEPGALGGRSFLELVDLDDLRGAIAAGTPFRSEDTRLATARGPIDVALSLSHLPRGEGEPPRSVVIFRDVRERKAAEEALRESEHRFRAIFESAAVGMVRAALSGEILECNAAYATMLGRARDDLVGTQWTEYVHPTSATRPGSGRTKRSTTRSPSSGATRTRAAPPSGPR